MNKKNKILITGGAGYSGSHTVVELQQKGHEVVIIDDLSNSNSSVIDAIEKITGIKPAFYNFNLCDKKELSSFFSKEKNIDAIILFAAYKAVGESVNEPLKYYHNNLFSLINLLEGMKENNVKNIVFSSSCAVYGEPDTLPVNENAPLKKATSPYGNTKQINEDILADTAKVSNIRAIALRYFNPVGAHDSKLIGELPNGIPNNLAPFITQTAIGKREQLLVNGDDYNTPDGTCIRDYIHVVDIAKAHIIAIERLIENKNKSNFEVFNLGTGKGNSVLEVIKSFEKVSGKKLNYKIIGRRAGDIEKIYADSTLASTELNWTADKTIDDMMLSAWEWEVKLADKK